MRLTEMEETFAKIFCELTGEFFLWASYWVVKNEVNHYVKLKIIMLIIILWKKTVDWLKIKLKNWLENKGKPQLCMKETKH